MESGDPLAAHSCWCFEKKPRLCRWLHILKSGVSLGDGDGAAVVVVTIGYACACERSRKWPAFGAPEGREKVIRRMG